MGNDVCVRRADEVGEDAEVRSKFPTYADDGVLRLPYVVIVGGKRRIGYFADFEDAEMVADALRWQAPAGSWLASGPEIVGVAGTATASFEGPGTQED